MTVLIFMAGLLGSLPARPGSRLRRRVHPRAWAVLSVVRLSMAALYVTVGLLLISAPAFVTVTAGRTAGHSCQMLLDRFDPGGMVMAWVAAALLVSSSAAAGVRVRRACRRLSVLRVPAYVGAHERRCGFDLVTLPTAEPLAYSVNGASRQAVITAGLRDRLDEAQLEAVVAHESAHLRSHHQRWLMITDVAATILWFVPWSRYSARRAAVTLECWADSEAASVAGTEPVREALLLICDAWPAPAAVAALNGADAVDERLSLLERPVTRGQSFGPFSSAVLSTAVAAAAAGALGMIALVVDVCSVW